MHVQWKYQQIEVKITQYWRKSTESWKANMWEMLKTFNYVKYMKGALQVDYNYVKTSKEWNFLKKPCHFLKELPPELRNLSDSGLFFPMNLCLLVSWKNSPEHLFGLCSGHKFLENWHSFFRKLAQICKILYLS